MIEKGREDTGNKQSAINTKYTQEDIKQILITSFDDIHNLICEAGENGDIKKAFELADQYIKDFESIDNLVQNKNISQETKKIISYSFSGRFRIFPLRKSLLKDLDDISEKEKIQKLDDMYQKLELWINFYAEEKDRYGMLAKLRMEYFIKRNQNKNVIIKKKI